MYDMDGIKVQPLQDFILIKLIPLNTTKAGLIIPEGSRVNINNGEILAFGPKAIKEDIPKEMNIAVGDQVYYNKHAGFRLSNNADNLFLIKYTDLYAKVHGDTKVGGLGQ